VLFQDWVHFTPLLVLSGNPRCALFQTHTLRSTAGIKETFVQTVFAFVNSAVVEMSVFFFLVVQSDIFAVMIA